jgi:hypothetical protein
MSAANRSRYAYTTAVPVMNARNPLATLSSASGARPGGGAMSRRGATDKRSNLAELTAKGRQKLAETAPGHVAAVRHLVIDALTGEQQRALAQISEAITAQADTPTP